MEQLLKITQEELTDKRITGLEDTPGLSATAMQARFDAHPDRNTEVINENARRQDLNNAEILKELTAAKNEISKKQDSVLGKNLSDENFTLEEKNKLSAIEEGANNFELVPATTVFLGGVMVGDGLEISGEGVVSAKGHEERIKKSEAALLKKVDIQQGKGLSEADFTNEEKEKLKGVEQNANNYSLMPATSSCLGGIKAGEGVEILSDGTLNVNVKGSSYDDTTIRQSLDQKVDKQEGKGLSESDFTKLEKEGLTRLLDNEAISLEAAPTSKTPAKNVGTLGVLKEKTGCRLYFLKNKRYVHSPVLPASNEYTWEEITGKSGKSRSYSVLISKPDFNDWGSSAPFEKSFLVNGMSENGLLLYSLEDDTPKAMAEFQKITAVNSAKDRIDVICQNQELSDDINIRIEVIS